MQEIISFIECIVRPVSIIRHVKYLEIRLGILESFDPRLHQLLSCGIGQNQAGMIQNLSLKLTGKIDSRLTVLSGTYICHTASSLFKYISNQQFQNSFNLIEKFSSSTNCFANIDSCFILSHQHLKMSSRQLS